MSPRKASKITQGSFGVPLESQEPHVLVEVTNGKNGLVRISEVRQTVSDELVKLPRAELSKAQWRMIYPTAQRIFNEQLLEDRLPQGRFLAEGATRLSITNLGKELILLAWAVEDANETEVEIILSSWMRLNRIERWWMFNQTVALNGDPRSRGRGWRLAVRHALSATPAGPESDRSETLPIIEFEPHKPTRSHKLTATKMQKLFRKEEVA